MTDSLEDTIATALKEAPEQGDWPWEDHCDGVASFVVQRLRAAGVVPVEPATHDTPRWTMGAGDVIYGDDGDSSIECKQGSYRNAGLAQDVLALLNAADAAVAVVDGKAPADE